jgi:hypothetical protein
LDGKPLTTKGTKYTKGKKSRLYGLYSLVTVVSLRLGERKTNRQYKTLWLRKLLPLKTVEPKNFPIGLRMSSLFLSEKEKSQEQKQDDPACEAGIG